MDSRGAGFAFDATMDFSNAFTTMPQQQQQHSLIKPAEDNTSAAFFFGDEGIDTTGFSQTFDTMNPALLSTPQTSFDMQHPLAMDNTMVSTAAWNGQLTPDSHHSLNAFPSTPVQTFDSLYQPSFNTALGKRPLQLDELDFPQAKRHETADFTLFSPLPSSASASGSWVLDTHTAPATCVEVGLSDEAADVCATWFNKYAVLPSDRHIESLSQLTGESADAIRSWFGRLLKQGMGGSHGDSAYKSQTNPIHQEPEFWNDDFSTDLVHTSPPQLLAQIEETITLDAPGSHDTTTVSQPASTLRGSKKRCTPTEDRELLSRDPNKIYQCTRKCGKRYGRKCDWKRNEEEGYPCKSWVCSLCTGEGVDNVKPCFRKYHFVQHFRNIHPGINADDYDEASVVSSETEFPRKCGFCRHRFSSRQERINHIADHFKQGKCMLDWNDGDGDDSQDSDNSDDNDDDNDGSGGDDFERGKPSYQPPRDPRGGSGSKYYGRGAGGNGSDDQPPQGGFFHFQLSQLDRDNNGCQPSRDEQRIDSTSVLLSNQLRPISESGDGEQSSIEGSTSAERPSLVQRIQSEGDHKDALARNVLSHSIDHFTPQSFLSVRLLGAGGFSTVDEVVHRDTKLHMGRKTLKNRDQTAVDEIRKEVDVLQKLRHPHVIRFLGAYSTGNKMSILVSPVAETTLALWMGKFVLEKPANLTETIVQMFGCLASSVRYLHEQRPVIKHMDIKPQNILITGGDQDLPHVTLCDFGISCSEDVIDRQGKPLTLQYSAPEVFQGSTRKQAADVWSLGCVFAEMASVPFSQGNPSWLSFRKEFSGRTGKYYWQDVPGLQSRLSEFLEAAPTMTEQTVVRTLQTMLNAEPNDRPDATSLTMVFTPAPCCLNWPNDQAIFPGPHEELGQVEMFHKDGVDCHAGLCLRERTTEATRTDLSTAKCWLDECAHTHDACREQILGISKALPTRLVDILPDGQAGSYVRLVNSTTIESTAEQINYVALSHIWAQQHVTLSSDSLQDMQTELPLQTLSTELNAAISTAQRLGYRYIWADSLCILQDSEYDKHQECAVMASVFRNASLTVVLDQMTTPEHRLPISASLPAIDFTTPGFGWDTRAWALQERLLSRRFLHLGAQMYWECNALKASETFPRGLSPLVWEKVHSKTIEGVQPRVAAVRPSIESALSFDTERDTLEKIDVGVTPRRLRNSQRVKKEGDDVGGVDQAAQLSQTFVRGRKASTAAMNRSHGLRSAMADHGATAANPSLMLSGNGSSPNRRIHTSRRRHDILLNGQRPQRDQLGNSHVTATTAMSKDDTQGKGSVEEMHNVPVLVREDGKIAVLAKNRKV